ncbi:MAG: lipocalin family protein [Chitinophagales bacterium]
MKNIITTALLLLLISVGFAKGKKEAASPLIGSWKFTRESKINDFQKAMAKNSGTDFTTEYFIFEKNQQFRHEFIAQDGAVIKVLTGKWKIADNKVKIEYANIDYTLNTDYFFIADDLVLGQNFNHVVLSKGDKGFENLDNKNVALK